MESVSILRRGQYVMRFIGLFLMGLIHHNSQFNCMKDNAAVICSIRSNDFK